MARFQCTYTKQPSLENISRDFVKCTHEELELVSSSNIMFRIKNGKNDGYFSLIYQHSDQESYLKGIINDYYNFVTKDFSHAENDRALMLSCVSDPDGRKKFFCMGDVWHTDSPVSVFLDTGDPTQIGLACDPLDHTVIERIKLFVRKYAWCAVAAYKNADQGKKNAWQTAPANRTLATQALAELLGLSYMIPKSEYRWLEIDGKYRCLGLFTERAAGEDVTQMLPMRRKEIISPALQRELNRLHMFDVLCTQKDHCPENYHVIVNDGEAVGISVFDNNATETFSLHRGISFESYIHCIPLINKQGQFNRPYYDAELAMEIKRLTGRDIWHKLNPYLGRLPLLMLSIRVSELKKILTKSLQEGSAEVKNRDEWNRETLNKELQWSCGKTYLHSFLYDCMHV